MELSSLAELANVINRLGYDDRMTIGQYISDAARDWAKEENIDSLTAEYFATLLTSFVESQELDEEEQ